MGDKLGVFICSGYGIADAIDLDALQGVVNDECGAALCELVPTCEGADLAAICDKVVAEDLSQVVLAGPSSRIYNAADLPKASLEYVNLQDWVVRTHPAQDEDTQMAAEDYLRMACARVKGMKEVTLFEEHADLDKTILVVGGGLGGLTAAKEASDAGYDVVVVEKEEQLGGYAAKLHKSIPHKPPYRELEDVTIGMLVDFVEASGKITVHKGTTISGIEGGPGLFDVTLANGVTFRAGAIVQATGFTPVEPTGYMGYGEHADVITNHQLEEMAANGGIKRPSNGEPAKNVAFVQCHDSRDADVFSYSSSIQSLNALKQAMYVREDAEARAYIFFEHMKTPAQYEDFYRAAQEDAGIFMTRGSVSAVNDGGGMLTLDVDDTMLGDQLQVEVDLVVLNAGMKPVAADGEMIRKLVDSKAIVAEGPSNAKYEESVQTVEKLAEYEGAEILNLNYRQGPDMPALSHGYPDSHFICFPYETRRTGIYAAGTTRSPMDGLSVREDATGAALKAIQAVEMLSRGETVHPRAGDTAFPDFSLMRCTQCKRCTEECPFGAINEDAKGTPEYSVTRCRRCGICLGACPERIINFPTYNVAGTADMIQAVEVPDEWDEKPRILCLACENDAIPALELAAEKGLELSQWMRVIPVRCLGSINVVWIKEAISNGFDGVLMLGCKWGEDYQCHYIKGSELMDARGANIKETLQSMSMENERVQLHPVDHTDAEKVAKVMAEFDELIEEIGMNPFKGM